MAQRTSAVPPCLAILFMRQSVWSSVLLGPGVNSVSTRVDAEFTPEPRRTDDHTDCRMNKIAKQGGTALVRCAIYTRKSTEEGLEQEFNSLDAQREAGEA